MKKTSLILSLLIFLLSACAPSNPVTVVNRSSHTFCKVERTPNLSIYAPWQKRVKRIHLDLDETITLSGGDKGHILYLDTCDGRYTASNLGHWTEPGETRMS